MSSHEIVCLSSDEDVSLLCDEDEKSGLPVILSTVSVAPQNASIEILSEPEDIPNGNHVKKREVRDIDSDDAGPSTSTSAPLAKKHKVEITTVDSSKASKKDGDKPTKHKSRTSILVEDNKTLFEQFLTKCEQIDCSSDMKKGTGKARKHFESAQIEFVSSTEFKKTLEQNLVRVDRECVWGHLGELVKQLKLFKEREGDLTGSQKEKDLKKEQLCANDKDTYYAVLKSEQDDRTVKKLNKILKKIHKEILKLENLEVDFDDEDDSTYLMVSRYKARAAKVYEKLCQYTHFPVHADRMSKRKIAFSGTTIPAVNRCIEKFINNAVRTSSNCFPDYHDVFKLIKTVNDSDDLKISGDEMRAMASKAFREIGTEIKKRRQWDVEDSLYIHLDREDKPEINENDAELQKKLDDNGRIFVQKFNEIVEEFTQKQITDQKAKVEENKEKTENGDSSKSSEKSENEGGNSDEGDENGDGTDEEEDDAESDLDKPVDEEFESGEGSEDSDVEEITPEENSPEENTPEENTPEENTPEENTPEENTPEGNNIRID